MKIQCIGTDEYYHTRNFPEGIKCSRCKSVIKKEAYIKYGNGEYRLCRFCMSKLQRDNVREISRNIMHFPESETLYIGTKYHKCGKNKRFVRQMFNFADDEVPLVICVERCKICGAYIMEHKKYSKHWPRLRGYKIINSKTGKPFPKICAEPGRLKQVGEIKKYYIEVPAYIRESIRHPYHGGTFSGK